MAYVERQALRGTRGQTFAHPQRETHERKALLPLMILDRNHICVATFTRLHIAHRSIIQTPK